MVQGHDGPVVGGPLVRAHTEHGAHVAAHLHEEAARGAGVTRATPRLRPALGIVPALSRLIAPLLRQDAGAPQPKFTHNRQIRVIARILEALLEALIVRFVRQNVVARNVRGTQAFLPRHPLGGEKRTLARSHVDLAHGGDASARHTSNGHRPAPTHVASVSRREIVGAQAFRHHLEANVIADGTRVGHGLGASARNVDGALQDGVLLHCPNTGHSFRHQIPLRRRAAPSRSWSRCPGTSRDAGRRSTSRGA